MNLMAGGRSLPLPARPDNGTHPPRADMHVTQTQSRGRARPGVGPPPCTRMESNLKPYQIIERMVELRRGRSNADILAEIEALPPLDDEGHPSSGNEEYWLEVAYPYLALADVAAERRLRAAVPVLLDRACYGDPGEVMRGLRHSLEAAVDGDRHHLADVCLTAARSERLGTRLWAIDELALLGDPRSRAALEEAVRVGPEELRRRAQSGLERLDGGAAPRSDRHRRKS